METSNLIQLAAALVLPLSMIAVIVNRAATGKGLGVRVIQFVVASMVVPGVLILAVRGNIGGETSVAVIGALVGFLFASIAKFDER